MRHSGRYFPAVLSCQPTRERIAEQRIVAGGFDCSMMRDPVGGVGNVVDRRSGHQAATIIDGKHAPAFKAAPPPEVPLFTIPSMGVSYA
jgi:hypothetical protein